MTLLAAPVHATKNKKLLVTKGIATRSKDATSTRNKKLLVTKGMATTRSKDATSSSWPYYQEQEATSK